jgi:peptidoglycan hydrolase-like protein with peptidoglycan-binding domain
MPGPHCVSNSTTSCLRVTQIKELQASLSSLGFDPGFVDGKLGPRTLQAFNKFVFVTGLRRPDGDPTVQEISWIAGTADYLEGEILPSPDQIRLAANLVLRNIGIDANTMVEINDRSGEGDLQSGFYGEDHSYAWSDSSSYALDDHSNQGSNGLSARPPVPTRAFAGPGQFPPSGFRGYGFVAFPAGASDYDLDRHMVICQAYFTSITIASRAC